MISPVSVGEHLLSSIKNAELHVVDGGDHYFAKEKALEIASLVIDYLIDAAPDVDKGKLINS